ncbi:sigma-54-dependent Fis family transcriptional regulator [Pararhodobacter zhoushanensis]|uniref:XylR N-terminal domain-containing protein n=1 Tax=Pararhodobacter zhoushanensis TaxID=2479545 RepID=A0ABT3H540_9RHOB|nr:sigma-54-dependent Fis family transcriptional regulator [Pararhodobacter zhoushanensis]MCW1934925.1 XylR N-terminal domain-containing protein [Pararhodobacter zhoushanensis]
MTKRISLTEVSRRAPRILSRGDSKLLDEGAPPTLSDLAGALQFALGDGRIWLNDDRMVLMQTTSLGQLRKEMIDAVGIDQTRRMFRRVGWFQGIHLADVIAKRFEQQDLTAALAAGPRIHTMEGFVKVTTKRFEFDVARGHYHGEFYWHDSTEAVEHLAHFGICDCPVCWMLIGVPSGYTTRLFGHPVIFREMECTGMGAERCVIIGRNAEAWGDDVPELAEFGLNQPKTRAQPWKPPVDLPKPEKDGPTTIQGRSPAIMRARRLLERVGGYDEPVLLLGEPGTGKELFARRLHEIGRTPAGPFVSVNCSMFDAEETQAAIAGLEAQIERARGGTLFLNDVLALPKPLQGHLALRVQADDGKRLGFRILSACAGQPRAAVQSGAFRADLFYRLSLLPVMLPALRERRDDLPMLIEHFLTRHSRRHGKPLRKIGGAAMDLLLRYDYPGNVRELSNMIERGVIFAEPAGDLEISHLFAGLEEMPGFIERLHASGTIVRSAADGSSEGRTLQQIEIDTFSRAMDAAKGNVSAAARALGMTRAQLDYRLRKLEIWGGPNSAN